MPTTYKVTFPDGQVQKFDGPADMSEMDQQTRAIQERAFNEGKIATTWFGGYASDPKVRDGISQIISGIGGLTGNAPLAAAGPLAGRAIQAGAMKMSGLSPDVTAGDVTKDAVVGAAMGYGPAVVGKAMSNLAGSTVAHISPINGNWVQGVAGEGIFPYLGRTAGEIASTVEPVTSHATPEAVGKYVAGGMGQMADAIKRALGRLPVVEGEVVSPQAAAAVKQLAAPDLVSQPASSLAGRLQLPKPNFTASEIARGIAMTKAGIPQDKVIQILLSQRP